MCGVGGKSTENTGRIVDAALIRDGQIHRGKPGYHFRPVAGGAYRASAAGRTRSGDARGRLGTATLSGSRTPDRATVDGSRSAGRRNSRRPAGGGWSNLAD